MEVLSNETSPKSVEQLEDTEDNFKYEMRPIGWQQGLDKRAR